IGIGCVLMAFVLFAVDPSNTIQTRIYRLSFGSALASGALSRLGNNATGVRHQTKASEFVLMLTASRWCRPHWLVDWLVGH
ncbi:hypothetical protein, partial [Mesorhizobium sp.]|uniref:hypothetical protein n=1 Tax=Mesorhizobium sp. TaxID=1871066 RepID=UPI0025C276A5